MEHKSIVFRLSAFSAPAGKYNPNAPLNGNEDNFYVDDDLGDDIPGRCQTDSEMTLSDCGCLMVVADGMGGMNAGEVASAKAIETVKDFFSPGKITSKLAASSTERKKYLEQVIKEADRRIKEDAKQNSAHEGMGSTIILAWVAGGKVTISWCGDSRAYRYNPLNGIEPLSRDHSYVQELVNKGVLRYEDTFEHPQGNIVTRSLGDPNSTARPETREFDICNGDIILLCSDGLSGVLRDKKTLDYDGKFYPGDTIEDVIATHTDSMTQCRDALMEAAEKADWYDNVTVLLCQILNGAKEPKENVATLPQETGNNIDKPWYKTWGKGSILMLAVVVIGLCVVSFFLGRNTWKTNKEDTLPPEFKTVVGADNAERQPDDDHRNDSIPMAEVEKTDNAAIYIKEVQEDRIQEETDQNEAAREMPVTPSSPKSGEGTNATNSDTDISANLENWQIELIQELNNVQQEALGIIKNDIIEMVRSAAKDDEAKCSEKVKEVLIRSEYLSKLHNIVVDTLSPEQEATFNELREQIIDPNQTINTNAWDEMIKSLKNRGEDAQQQAELTPAS